MIRRLEGGIVLVQLSDMDSNIYLLGDTAIDSGTGFNFTRLRDVFRILKRDMKDVKQVVNTHGHFDHVGGNGYFLEAQVAIHEDDATILESGNAELSAADFFDGKLNPRKVDRKLRDGDRVKAGPFELEVIHTPGHTRGSICLFERKKDLLFSGDLVFSTGLGRADFANSDPARMAASLERINSLPVKQVLPGHGEPFGKKELGKLAEISDYV